MSWLETYKKGSIRPSAYEHYQFCLPLLCKDEIANNGPRLENQALHTHSLTTCLFSIIVCETVQYIPIRHLFARIQPILPYSPYVGPSLKHPASFCSQPSVFFWTVVSCRLPSQHAVRLGLGFKGTCVKRLRIAKR